jgi:hypothetical protein
MDRPAQPNWRVMAQFRIERLRKMKNQSYNMLPKE